VQDHDQQRKLTPFHSPNDCSPEKPDDVYSILSGKLALTYAGSDVEAMRSIANAHKERSLSAFQKNLADFKEGESNQSYEPLSHSPEELQNDALIHNHLNELYDTMLQQNLCRIIEPYSSVEIAHVASLIDLEVTVVEKK
jgi:26S proteasome regulatory subunit N6